MGQIICRRGTIETTLAEKLGRLPRKLSTVIACCGVAAQCSIRYSGLCMIEVLTNAEMSEADRLTIAQGIAGRALMENAGKAVAQAVAATRPSGSRVIVLAGPGNNGGDGFVAARLLAERQYAVSVLLVGSADRLKGDAAAAAKALTGAVASAVPDRLAGADIIVDAL